MKKLWNRLGSRFKLSLKTFSYMSMKIRSPFKDYLLRWKDDATNSEKFIWSVFLAGLGMSIGKFIFSII